MMKRIDFNSKNKMTDKLHGCADNVIRVIAAELDRFSSEGVV